MYSQVARRRTSYSVATSKSAPARRSSLFNDRSRRESFESSALTSVNFPAKIPWENECKDECTPRRGSVPLRQERRQTNEENWAFNADCLIDPQKAQLNGNSSPAKHSGDFPPFEVDSNVARWKSFVLKLCKSDWNNLRKRIQKLVPQDINEIFDKAEHDNNIKILDFERKRWYLEFKRLSGCFDYSTSIDRLNWDEIEDLVCYRLELNIPRNQLKDLIKSKKLEAEDVNKSLDFGEFLSLMCFIRNYPVKIDQPKNLSVSQFIPIDPDSGSKQAWDLFCMLLLLYCSLSIPFSVAFFNTEDMPSTLQNLDLMIDSLFMFDILLSFLTCYVDKGFIVRDLRQIARHYLGTWFLPDFAGSFPFDQVIALVLENQPGMNSTNVVRILRFIRMLKLIRAVRFMNKLSQLKQKEGFEHFGNAISVASSFFLIIFIAHLLGCCFTMLLDAETRELQNWLTHYSADLAYADTWTRYETALYWAIVTITTMGYGDVVPVTHIERMYVVFVAVIGAVVFSYCMGTISLLVAQVSCLAVL